MQWPKLFLFETFSYLYRYFHILHFVHRRRSSQQRELNCFEYSLYFLLFYRRLIIIIPNRPFPGKDCDLIYSVKKQINVHFVQILVRYLPLQNFFYFSNICNLIRNIFLGLAAMSLLLIKRNYTLPFNAACFSSLKNAQIHTGNLTNS